MNADDSFEAELLTDREEQSVGLLGNMEARAEHQKTKHYHALYSFTTSVGVGLITLVLFWILYYHNEFSWQSNPQQQFYWHPFLMVLGMVFLYSQSMLIYRTFRNYQKVTLKIIHATLHFLAFILSVIGLKAVFDSHNLANPPVANLYTLHSWIGLITVIIFSIQFLTGFLSFLFPGFSNSLRRVIMPFHTAFGIGTFMLAIVTAMTGLKEKALWTLGKDYEKLPSEALMFNFIGVFMVFYGIMVLYLVNHEDYKRTNLAEDEIRHRPPQAVSKTA